MFQIDNSTAVSAMPSLAAAGAPGFFSSGNPALGLPATVVSQDWLNGVQTELMNLLAAANVSASKTKLDQLALAVRLLGLLQPFSESFAEEGGGYPFNAIVADATTAGLFWRSTANSNAAKPGASGSNWAVGALGGAPLSVVTMISSGTYTAPYADPTLRFRVRAQGPGGGGGYVGTQNAYEAAAAGGASAGSYCEVWLTYEQLFGSTTATTVPVTIGSGGTNTGAGGSTSVGSAIVVPGGNGATAGTSAGYSTLSPGAPAPALCTFPSISPTVVANIPGQPGGYGITTNPQEGGNFFGFSGAGGRSMMGASAPSVGENQTGQTGGLGAGGSGACAYNGASGTSSGFDGGTGGTGCVVIECFSGI